MIGRAVRPRLLFDRDATSVWTAKIFSIARKLLENLLLSDVIAYILGYIFTARDGVDLCVPIFRLNLPVGIKQSLVIVDTCIIGVDLEAWETLD